MKTSCHYKFGTTLHKLALLLFTITLFACGGGSAGGGGSGTTTPVTTKLTIADASGNEGGNITFTVTSTPNIAEPISFDYRIDFEGQTNPASTDDFTGVTTGKSTIAANSDSITIAIAIKDDDIREAAETFNIVLSDLSRANTTFTKSTAAGTIAASDPIEIRIADASGNEGNMLNFKITANPTITEPISFSYRTDFSGQTANANDLSSDITGISTIVANDSSTTITIEVVDDTIRENDETFRVVLSNLSLPNVIFVHNIGIGTILANDVTGITTISISDATANEVNSDIVFRVNSSATATTAITFEYEAIVDNTFNNSASSNDFEVTSGTATIIAGDSSTTISIPIALDNESEQSEKFRLLLKNPSNAVLAKIYAIGTILNYDLGEISNVVGAIDDGEIAFYWTNPNDNIFEGVTIAQLNGTTAPANCSGGNQLGKITSHDATGLNNGSDYSFRICARYLGNVHSEGVELANIALIVVDSSGNGLIDITNATELNNIRYNLAGTSYKTSISTISNTNGCPASGCDGYELINDIDSSSFTNWDPIGSSSDRFTAAFEGNNRTISNLTITDNDDYVGLFSAIQNAAILNLKLTNVKIKGRSNVGALVGAAANSNLYNIELIGNDSQASDDAEIQASANRIGGLVGYFSGGTIRNSSSSLTIAVIGAELYYIGGLVGDLNSAGKVVSSSNSGSILITGSACCTGGLVGRNDLGIISQSWSSGEILGRADTLGGLVGINDGTISQSWSSGEISGGVGSRVGGLVGSHGSGTINQSWASGNVSGNNDIGGLVGRHVGGNINGRNYQLNSDGGVNIDLANTDNAGESFILANLVALANLSGANGGNYGTYSNWHGGFGSNLLTRFCDTNGNGIIDGSADGFVERTANNSVWVMGPASSDVAVPNVDIAGNTANYYAIPALRCIGTTPAERQANIDRQRRNFPRAIPPRLSIENVTGNEGNDLAFMVVSNITYIEPISFNYKIDFVGQNNPANSADLSSDTRGSGIIAVGEKSTTIPIAIKNDNIREDVETFRFILSDPSPDDTIFINREAIGTIATSDMVDGVRTNIRIADATGIEGENIVFTVTSEQTITDAVSFNYRVAFKNPQNSNSANAADLSSDTSGSGIIAANSDSTTILIAIKDDSIREDAETFRLILSSLSQDDVIFTNSEAIGTITANNTDGVRTNISIGDATGVEGENIIFTVTSEQTITEAISFNYRVAFKNPQNSNSANTADLSSDTRGSGIIAANGSSTTISIEIIDDIFKENSETFSVILSDLTPTDATFTKNTAIGTIATSDLDKVKTNISISDAEAREGENIIFTVTSEQTITEAINFNYRVAFKNPQNLNSANAADLVLGTSGSGIIAANSDSTTISIEIIDDVFKENSETFSVILSDLTPTDTTFTKSTAIGTIATSDLDKVKTNISISDAEASEDNNLMFTVTVNPAIAEQISFDYRVDFTGQKNPASTADLSGQLTGKGAIAANDSSTTISIAVVDDNIREDSETFNIILNASSDIGFTDNIGIGIISASEGNFVIVSISDAIASEASGDIVFRVNSNVTATTTTTFEYEVTTDSNLSNSVSFNDFEATSGTATIIAGDSSTTISIPIALDNESEQSEKFRLLLKNPRNAILAKIYAIGTILNYDLGEISNVTGVINDGQIALNWTNSSDNIFEGVTIAQTIGKTAPANCSGGNQLGQITSHDMTGLSNGLNYSFRICTRYSGNIHSDGIELANITTSTVDSNGNGLIDITNASQLNNIRYNLSGTSLTNSSAINNTRGCPARVCNGYELMNDIDLSSFTNWDPIGSNSSRFTATFDGNNNTISGLTITGNNSYVGLFSVIQNATIQNLKLTKVKVSGANYIGALVGSTTFDDFITILSNIELIGDNSQASDDAEIQASGHTIGGLVGHFGVGTIRDSSSSLTIRANAYNIGGLVGDLRFVKGNVVNSSNSGAVFISATACCAGGLIGRNHSGTISKSWASGSISGGDADAVLGGLVGQNGGNISQSWASGEISSEGDKVGGLVGEHRVGTIIQSWSSGEILSEGDRVGGLVGSYKAGIIAQSWSSGNVSGNSDVGGLVGDQQGGTIIQSWSSSNVSGNNKLGGLVGNQMSGSTNGRNYQLDSDGGDNIDLANTDNAGESFILANLIALANLSGANDDNYGTHSNWHAGFNDIIFTMFCDTNGNGTIETDEQTASNSVWVMGPASSDVPVPSVDIAGNIANYYAIPALRCIGTTPTERQANIDRQRRNFPRAIPPRLSIENVTGNEGSNLVFRVVSSIPVIEQINFDYKIDFGGQNNPANLADLSSDSTGRSTIAVGAESTTISIAIKDDSIREDAETFRLILSNPFPYDVIFTNPEAIGTITANDTNGVRTNISIGDATASEGENIVFTVTSEQTITEEVSFNYRVAFKNPQNSNSANAADLSSDTNGIGIIATNDSSTTISIEIINDIFKENSETFSVILSDLTPTDTTFTKSTAIGTILNYDLREVSSATAIIIGDSQIALNWTNPSDNIFEGVTIAQVSGRTAPANCSGGSQLGKVTSHDMTGLSNGSAYSFRICARYSGNVHSDGVELANITITVVDSNGNGLIDITNANQLNNIRYNLSGTSYKTSINAISNTNGCPANGCNGYELMNDINLNGFTNWDPIRKGSNNFSAILLNGNNKTISNLTINRPNANNIGLFGELEDATISNLKLTNIKIEGRNNVGGLVGQAAGTTTLSNIELIGDNSQASDDAEIQAGYTVGGLVGGFNGVGTIRNSSSSLTIRANDAHIGGLVGDLFGAGKVVNSSSSGAVFISAATCCAGGLVGRNLNGTISQSWASGSVSGGGNNPANDAVLGGLVGLNNATISQSWASGEASSGGNRVGGLVGGQNGGTIRQSWASGSVSGNNGVGGLVGRQLGGSINGRNYQLDSDGGDSIDIGAESFILANLIALANLSGASGSYGTHSNWHAGFGNDLTRYCDTDNSGTIETDEQTANNSVWVMGPAPSDIAVPTTDTAGNPANYYAIPAIRCIGTTPAERQANIDQQRRNFPRAIQPSLSIENVNITGNEGSNLDFRVISNIPVIEPISFNYRVDFGGQNNPANSADLSSETTGRSTIAVGDSSTTISIEIRDDNIREDAETFRLILSNSSQDDAIFTNPEAIGTIATSDTTSRVRTSISIADATSNEGENIVFTVTSEQTITEAINFNYRVAFKNPQNSNSANAADLVSDTRGSGIIAANGSSTTISIEIIDDIFKENSEAFSVILSDLIPTDATFIKSTAIGTIATSDIGRVKTNISISDAEASEDNNLMFTVTVNPAIAEQVSFDYRVDFTGQENPASTADLSGQLTGKITIAANDSSTTISIAVASDDIRENAETFNIILSASSDVGFTDNIGIGIISASEGNFVIVSISDAIASKASGDIVFRVNSSFTATTAITFEYEATTDSSLTNPASVNDFEATSGTATIIAGDSSTTISIPIALDNESEQFEKFRLLLKNPRNAILAKIYAIGTILNYDLGEISNVNGAVNDSQIRLKLD